MEELCNKIEEKIEEISKQELNNQNLEKLDILVDIKKDIANMDYWKKKEGEIDMRNYRVDYGARGVPGTGRYRGEESYGRRGVPGSGRGRYREGNYSDGEEMIDNMAYHYGNYMEGRSYGGQETDKAFDYMLKSAEEFFMHLMEESDSPEQMEKLRRTAKRISEMM